MTAAARVIGVIGAGTMGAGIAQLAARSGARTLMFDPLPEALEKGTDRVRAGLRRDAERGRLQPEQAESAIAGLEAVAGLEAFGPCDLVIEAAPERLDLKHEVFGKLAEIVDPRCVLATNTSSLLVTRIAAGVVGPERVVGMHFFNPAPVMQLLEVVAGELSDERALAVAKATGVAMGKTVIDAKDGPGFVVNRCNRPFALEALRLLAERIADVPTIDAIVKGAGGFRMGPFELMDLVGIDTGLEIAISFHEQSFGDPRWRPSPIVVRYVAAGLLGRKAGRGFYDSPADAGGAEERPEDSAGAEDRPAAGGAVVITGEGPIARELRAAAGAAGYEVRGPADEGSDDPSALWIECDARPGARAAARPAVILCGAGSLRTLDPSGESVGFHALSPFDSADLVELTRSVRDDTLAIAAMTGEAGDGDGDSARRDLERRAEQFFGALGKRTTWVGDAPGLVLGRIVCQLINEAAFALGEGIGAAEDIDLGMTLGLNHPRGPLAWAREIGVEHVLTVLEALCDEYREDRYRPAPVLRRWRALERAGAPTA